MKAKVISYNLANVQAIEDRLNEWLEAEGDIQIDRCVPLGNAGPDRDCGAVIILYREEDQTKDAPSVGPRQQICRQCKKAPAIRGMKMCNDCREYQRQYREKQKEDKKARYP